MIGRDLLQELSHNAITAEQAEEILEKMLDSPLAAEIKSRLGFTNIEWTAYAHGATLQELATWRGNGWPTRCVLCGQIIDLARFGWRVASDGKGNSGLRHICCPKK